MVWRGVGMARAGVDLAVVWAWVQACAWVQAWVWAWVQAWAWVWAWV